MRPRVFPRGRHCRHRGSRRADEGFNEAAGIPRGRPVEVLFPDRRRLRSFNEAAGIPRGRRPERDRNRRGNPRASMRPRVFPAEDQEWRQAPAGEEPASMRPRVFPAEGEDVVVEGVRLVRASMRPRVFPAEDTGRPEGRREGSTGFNEAAGIPRGRHSMTYSHL